MEDLRVHDLCIPGLPQWDVGLLEDLFQPRDVEAITKIPLRHLEGQDKIIWHLDKIGTYSVRSGYRWWIEHVSDLRTHRVQGPWTNLWAAEVPPKFKIMTWLLARNIVPTRAVLRHRHIDVPHECGMCDSGSETNMHLFGQCDYALNVWEEAGVGRFVYERMDQSSTFQQWLDLVLNSGECDQIEKIMALLWSLWRERNARVWRNEKLPAFVITRLAMEGLTDWKQVRLSRTQNPITTHPPPPPPHPPSGAVNGPPPHTHLKCNVDWAGFTEQRMSGIGAMLRDSNGSISEYLMMTKQGCPPAKDGEAIALFEVIQ
ncbi:Putative ribonuclease H protein At1g65750 [Linum perenne]